ncbi:MAG: hypothetical protein AAB289_13390, partial [Chloroflexota bacterium]
GALPLVLTMLKAFATYVRLAVMPHPLSLEYLFPVKYSLDAEVLWGAFLLVGLLIFAWRRRKTSPIASFAAALFLLPLLPVSNILPIESVLNERFLYCSVIGLGLLLGQAAALGLNRVERRGVSRDWGDSPLGRGILAAGLAALFLAYGGLTVNRNRVWKDTVSLASANLKT